MSNLSQISDMKNQWMPFTGNRDFKAEPRLMVKAEGMYFWNHKGEKILDGSSGLFCCAAGHGRKEISEAVANQLLTLDYSPPFQTGQPLAFEFASRIAELAPEGMDYVFFTNSGSESVDTAMKIAYAYHRCRGEGQRQRFVSRERAYHGVNIGDTALSGLVKNREAFGVGLPGVVHMRHTWMEENRFTKGQPQRGAELADDLLNLVNLYGGDTIAACFVEPIAGSTGALIPPHGYLERLRQICDTHGILLVFDEVICGFGRTGKSFAADSFNVKPDIMTLAKALTNGALPMGAVVVGEHVYQAVMDAAPEKAIELFHGYTYSGHPAACAAGIATLDIYRDEYLFEKAAALSEYFIDSMFSLQDIDDILDIRAYGLLAGFDVKPGAAPGQRGLEFQKKAFHAGLNLKMTGDTGLIAPPFIAGRNHVDDIVAIIREALTS